MKFKNITGQAVKVKIFENRKIGGTIQGCKWVTVKPNATIDLEEMHGLALGFLKEGDIVKKDDEREIIPPENKQAKAKKKANKAKAKDEKKSLKFLNELHAIAGIGFKTAKDIIKVYHDREKLIQDIKKKASLPFRDDVAKTLCEKYK